MKKLVEDTIPCRVVTEKREDGDEVIFVFKDQETAIKYEDSFPAPFYQLICFDGPYNAYWCKRTTVH